MPKSIIELVVGDLEEKRAYRQFTKRMHALPNDYRFAFKKIQHYLYFFDTGCNMTMFTDLIDLFEASAADNKAVLDVIGSDAATFCDELLHASTINVITSREKLNQEILEYFYGEENSHAECHSKNLRG